MWLSDVECYSKQTSRAPPGSNKHFNPKDMGIELDILICFQIFENANSEAT